MGIGNINIYLANLHAAVAPIADFRVEDYRSIGCNYIGEGKYFGFFGHIVSYKNLVVKIQR